MAEDKSREEVGARLKSLREKMNLTQQQVADELKIPRSAVSLIESGDRGIDFTELEEYSKIFKTKIDNLVQKPKVLASENRTSAFYPSRKELEEEFAQMGIGDLAVETTNLLQAQKGIDLKRTKINFHLNLANPDLRGAIVGWVDELHARWPGSKPALQLDLDGLPGNHLLACVTLN